METPKTFKELFANTGIEPTTDESGNTHYSFKATMKEEPKQQQCYSEEDMAQSFMACWVENVPYGIECKVSFNEWFEQFKKK
jgi:hypothetical protein